MSKKLMCIEDFYMKYSGERVFTKGKLYEVLEHEGKLALIDDRNYRYSMYKSEHIFVEPYGYQSPLWKVLNGV